MHICSLEFLFCFLVLDCFVSVFYREEEETRREERELGLAV
jgi:hypothetical protein